MLENCMIECLKGFLKHYLTPINNNRRFAKFIMFFTFGISWTDRSVSLNSTLNLFKMTFISVPREVRPWSHPTTGKTRIRSKFNRKGPRLRKKRGLIDKYETFSWIGQRPSERREYFNRPPRVTKETRKSGSRRVYVMLVTNRDLWLLKIVNRS